MGSTKLPCTGLAHWWPVQGVARWDRRVNSSLPTTMSWITGLDGRRLPRKQKHIDFPSAASHWSELPCPLKRKHMSCLSCSFTPSYSLVHTHSINSSVYRWHCSLMTWTSSVFVYKLRHWWLITCRKLPFTLHTKSVHIFTWTSLSLAWLDCATSSTPVFRAAQLWSDHPSVKRF